MLRITATQSSESAALLKLEGKLLEPWIGELCESCRRQGDRATTLDLAGVSYIDPSAAIALRDMRRRGVKLTGCSPLVVELLKETQ